MQAHPFSKAFFTCDVGGRRTPKWSIPTFAASAQIVCSVPFLTPASAFLLFLLWLSFETSHLAPPVSPFISPQQTDPPSFQPQFHHHSLPINHPEYFYFVNKIIYSSLISSLQHLCVLKNVCIISCHTSMLWMSLKAALLWDNKIQQRNDSALPHINSWIKHGLYNAAQLRNSTNFHKAESTPL